MCPSCSLPFAVTAATGRLDNNGVSSRDGYLCARGQQFFFTVGSAYPVDAAASRFTTRHPEWGDPAMIGKYGGSHRFSEFNFPGGAVSTPKLPRTAGSMSNIEPLQ